jgi:Cellulase (glycosyl hydrolase family 5)
MTFYRQDSFRAQVSLGTLITGVVLSSCGSGGSAAPLSDGGGAILDAQSSAGDSWTVGDGATTATEGGGVPNHPDGGEAGNGQGDAGTAPPGGFITASGTNLMLNGEIVQFIGFDAYGMTGCFNGTAWTTAQLDAYFSGLPANGMTRIWATQSYGTAAIATVVAQAAKYEQHVLLVLGNDDGNCDSTTTDPNQTGEPLSFYETGWQAGYVTWVNTIVPVFKNNATVGMWEVANEPGHATSVPEATLKAYLAGAAAAIKAVDPNHLVESGVNDPQDVTNYQDAQSSPDIDVLSFHDYAWDYENKAVESGNFTVAQAASVALGKPFIAGEAGVESGPTCTADLTESQRVTYLQTKANDYLAGIAPGGSTGVRAAGIMFWEYEPVNTYGWTTGECIYDFFAGDPLIAMVQNYTVP